MRAIYVGGQCKRYDFTFVQPKWPKSTQALNVLERLEEAFVVLIKLAENLEQVQVYVLWHIYSIFPESAQLNELGFSSAGFDREHFWYNLPEKSIEVVHVNLTVLVVIGEAEDQVDLTWCQSQLLGIANDRTDVLD